MPESNPISDAELAELRRLHEQTLHIERTSDEFCEILCAMHNAFGPILARLEAAERERDNLEAELEEARENANGFEKDCKTALVTLATRLGFEWDGDGATADTLLEHVMETVDEAKRRMSGITERDAKQRREGAAQVWDQIASIGRQVTDQFIHLTATYAEERAQKLREGGE